MMKKYMAFLLVFALILNVGAAFAGAVGTNWGTIQGNSNGMSEAVMDGEEYYLTLDNAIIDGSLVFNNPSSGKGIVHIILKGHNVINGAESYNGHFGIDISDAEVIISPEKGSSLVINGNDQAVYLHDGNDSFIIISNTYPTTGVPSDKQFIIGIPAGAAPAAPAASSSSAPKTGDSANIALWLGLMAASALCVSGMMRKAKKEY